MQYNMLRGCYINNVYDRHQVGERRERLTIVILYDCCYLVTNVYTMSKRARSALDHYVVLTVQFIMHMHY